MPWDLIKFRRSLHLTQRQMAKRLGLLESDYKILESFHSLVPDPLPVRITDRLNAISRERATSGQVRKMPSARCLIHECRLKRYKWQWLWPLRGKKKQWWAVCPAGGELYTVRTDGLVRLPPRLRPLKPIGARPGRGRPASKRALFIKAWSLRKSKPTLTWRRITQKLARKEFDQDPHRATERLRIGVQNLKKKSKQGQ
jgi:hypothetical protein